MRAAFIGYVMLILVALVALRSGASQSAPPALHVRVQKQPAPEKALAPPLGPEQRAFVSRPARTEDSAKALWMIEVTGDPRDSSPAARQLALEAAARKLGDYLRTRYAGFQWAPTPQFLTDNKMVVAESEVTQEINDADAPLMFRTRLTIQLHRDALNAALQEDRKLRVESRLWQAGRGLGGLLFVLAAIVGYVRLDDWSKGYFSLPLKLTALAVAVAGPAALWWMI